MGMVLGLTLGLGCALMHSVCYLSSRWFVQRSGAGVRVLMVVSHVMMGVIAICALLALQIRVVPDLARAGLPLAGSVGFYLAGQFLFLVAMKETDPSRLAPLLGVKVFVVALLAFLLVGQSLTFTQWIAVIVTVTATLLLLEVGGRIPMSACLALSGAVVFFALSDLHIQLLIDALSGYGKKAALLGTALVYILCGAVALLALLGKVRPPFRVWLAAVPFSLSWFMSMCLFFGAIAALGVVFAAILQSTRGLVSIGLAVLVARLGFLDIERHVAPRIVLRRVAAALMMVGAVALYLLGAE